MTNASVPQLSTMAEAENLISITVAPSFSFNQSLSCLSISSPPNCLTFKLLATPNSTQFTPFQITNLNISTIIRIKNINDINDNDPRTKSNAGNLSLLFI